MHITSLVAHTHNDTFAFIKSGIYTYVPAVPSETLRVTVTSHPRLTVSGVRSSCTHNMTGVATVSDTVMEASKNTSAADPTPLSPVWKNVWNKPLDYPSMDGVFTEYKQSHDTLYFEKHKYKLQHHASVIWGLLVVKHNIMLPHFIWS